MEVPIYAVEKGHPKKQLDQLAIEEPLEIRVVCWQGQRQAQHSLSITMRTPVHDFELAAGFLFTEGIINDSGAIDRIEYSNDPAEPKPYNVVHVYLKHGVTFDLQRLSRHVYTSSSCGICGKTSLEMVRTACSQPPLGQVRLSKEFFLALPETLQREQILFSRTGGLHASALFDAKGRLLLVREDVGRHNTMDKLVGALLLDNRLPASDTIVLVSGRASFELVQKAVMAGIPVMAAIGAPSSMAVAVAREFGMTLIAFLRDQQFNVYVGRERLSLDVVE